MLEEYIVQTTDLSDFHPSSLNTLRVSTIRCPNDDVIIFHPFLRLGVGPSIVDNAGSGGLICSVDVSTGEVTACCDECGRRYEYHPDTKRQILGYQIPIWHEIICFVEQLSKSSPKGTNYVGWDIAITDDGCKLVEGNSRGQFIWQYAEQKGCRDELEGIVRLNFDFA